MATTILGYVTRTFAGRAGLFTATILPTSGGAAIDVQVSDLDGEPERFNERMTKTRLLRDAMDLAEPVVVVYEVAKAGGNEVESVQRLTRHHEWVGQWQEEYVGIVLHVGVREQTQAGAFAQASDVAEVSLIDPLTGITHALLLAMQRPERQVMEAMLQQLQDAAQSGEPIAVRCARQGDAGDTSPVAQPAQWISWVERADLKVRERAVVDGFVEQVLLQQVRSVAFGRVLITTAPPFIDAGGVVDPSYFKPRAVSFLVPQRSPMLHLLEQALNAGQRVRVTVASSPSQQDPKDPNELKEGSKARLRSMAMLDDVGMTTLPDIGNSGDTTPTAREHLAVAVILLAPLASQARPVWVRVKREALDQPPPGMCGGPVPTSDLSPVNVASLQVPHRAAWEGCGCFNRGVYRIQVVSPVPVRMLLDGKELSCVFAMPFSELENGEGKLEVVAARSEWMNAAALPKPGPGDRQHERLAVYLGHVCIEDCHTLRIEVDEWRCGNRFELDVMKLR